MKAKIQQRSWYILAIIFIAAGITLIILGALKENIVFFMTPTEWLEYKKNNPLPIKKNLRLGGRVSINSIKRNGSLLEFYITDEKNQTNVIYNGPVPDLFREGQGVVAEGTFNAEGVFIAKLILAKHDENYMPREVVNKLKQQELWQENK